MNWILLFLCLFFWEYITKPLYRRCLQGENDTHPFSPFIHTHKKKKHETATVRQEMKINSATSQPVGICASSSYRGHNRSKLLSLSLLHRVILSARYDWLHPTVWNPFTFPHIVLYLPNTSELDISLRLQIPVIRRPRSAGPLKIPSGF